MQGQLAPEVREINDLVSLRREEAVEVAELEGIEVVLDQNADPAFIPAAGTEEGVMSAASGEVDVEPDFGRCQRRLSTSRRVPGEPEA